MKIMNLRYILPLACFAFIASAASAQDLHGDVTVNADYLPTLRSHSRISPLPSAPKLSLPEMSLKVAYESVPTLLQPSLAPMSATGWNDNKNFSRYKGYLELAGGSYADFAVDAGYRFLDSEKATLGAWIQHLSSTGFKPESEIPDTKAHAAKRFDESLGIFGMFGIEGIGKLNFDIGYHLGYFNYYSVKYPDLSGYPTPPTQTLNDLHARIALQSPEKESGLTWSASLSDRYFGYRRNYRIYSYHTLPTLISKPAKENNLQLTGKADYGFNRSTGVELGLTANIVSYSGESESDSFSSNVSGYRRLVLNPAFYYSDDNFTARAGARFDITSNVGLPNQSLIYSEKDFGHVHVAPDIALSYRKGKLAAELKASGGTELHTLASGSQLYLYQSPQITTTLPMFSPLNASLGLNAGSFYGFSANVGLAYKITDNTTPDLIYNTAYDYFGNLYTINVKGFSLRAGLNYSYGDILSFNADMSYQPQNGTKGYFNGPDRPRWIIDLNADTNPWKTLHIYAGYHYRGVRSIWYKKILYINPSDFAYNSIFGDIPLIERISLGDVTDLNIGASYTFLERYTVRIDANNLLNTRNPITAGMPSEGFGIMGGISILF